MNGKRWTPDEDAYLKAWYPRNGAAACAKKLGRSYWSVTYRLSILAIGARDTGDVLKGKRVMLSELAVELGMSYNMLLRYARRDDVLDQQRPVKGREQTGYHVPRKWAAKIRRERREAQKNTQKYPHYIPVKTAADVLGVSWCRLYNRLSPNPTRDGWLARHLGDCHAVQIVGGNNHIIWALNPDDVQAARASIEQERRLARQWVPLKALEIETGVDRRIIARLAKRRGIKSRMLLIGGVLNKHYPPAGAAQIRSHYGVRDAA